MCAYDDHGAVLTAILKARGNYWMHKLRERRHGRYTIFVMQIHIRTEGKTIRPGRVFVHATVRVEVSYNYTRLLIAFFL
jgi:hypothetical protein